ncbi:MAG: hypothetical protein ACRCXN_00505 [Bacteroidales bacterium]
MKLKSIYITVLTFCYAFSVSAGSISSSAQNNNEVETSHTIEQKRNINLSRPPVIWSRYFYPETHYPELIQLINNISNVDKKLIVLYQLEQIKDFIEVYNLPKDQYYYIMGIIHQQVGDNANSNLYFEKALKESTSLKEKQLAELELKQQRIYELQSVILNKQKRSNIIFFLFLALFTAYIVLNRDSKKRHLLRKIKAKKMEEEQNVPDEENEEKINATVDIMRQQKRTYLTPEELSSLGFDSENDFEATFQLVKGMSPTEFLDKYK